MFNKPVPIVRKVWDPEKENRTIPAVPQFYFKAALLVATFRAFRYIRRNTIVGRQRFNIDDEKLIFAIHVLPNSYSEYSTTL